MAANAEKDAHLVSSGWETRTAPASTPSGFRFVMVGDELATTGDGCDAYGGVLGGDMGVEVGRCFRCCRRRSPILFKNTFGTEYLYTPFLSLFSELFGNEQCELLFGEVLETGRHTEQQLCRRGRSAFLPKEPGWALSCQRLDGLDSRSNQEAGPVHRPFYSSGC